MFLTTPRIFATVPAASLPSPPTGASVIWSCGAGPVGGPAVQSTPSFSSATETFLSSAARTLSRKTFEVATRSRRLADFACTRQIARELHEEVGLLIGVGVRLVLVRVRIDLVVVVVRAGLVARARHEQVRDRLEGLLAVAGARVLEVVVVVGLAPLVRRRLQADPRALAVLLDEQRIGLDVGHDADALDRDVARREVLRRRELEAELVVVGLVAEGDGRRDVEQHLHGALAERALADDDAAVEVLHGARDDLGRARRVLVDEDGERAPSARGRCPRPSRPCAARRPTPTIETSVPALMKASDTRWACS